MSLESGKWNHSQQPFSSLSSIYMQPKQIIWSEAWSFSTTMHSHTVHVKHKKGWNRVTGNVWTIQHESNIWDVTHFHDNEVEMAVNEWLQMQKPNLHFCQNRILNSCDDGKKVLVCSGIMFKNNNTSVEVSYTKQYNSLSFNFYDLGNNTY